MKTTRLDQAVTGIPASRFRKWVTLAVGWLAFILGWLGVFLPGLPTTIFWIIAAIAFLRTNRRMYARIIAHKRFGPGIRLFVEEGRIRRRGKIISISAMLCFAVLGSLAIPVVWVKFVVVGAALAGSVWVGVIPDATPAERLQVLPLEVATTSEVGQCGEREVGEYSDRQDE